MLNSIFEVVLSLVFPLGCEICGVVLDAHDPKGICPACRKTISLIDPPHCTSCGRTVPNTLQCCGRCLKEKFYFDRAYACVYYNEKMKKLLHAFKFDRRRFLLPCFTNILDEFMEKYLSHTPWDLVVSVPMDKTRERKRGFNQASLLGAAVAKKSKKPHVKQALGCRKAEIAQSFLKKSDRKQNVKDRFFVQKPDIVATSHVLLIDDILTTGQTASACAKALKNAKARSVTLLALARGA